MTAMATASTISPSAAEALAAPTSRITRGLANCRANMRIGEGPSVRRSSLGPLSASLRAASAAVSP